MRKPIDGLRVQPEPTDFREQGLVRVLAPAPMKLWPDLRVCRADRLHGTCLTPGWNLGNQVCG